MNEKQKRVLFLCAQHSVRELMAASLLTAQEPRVWDIWIAPASWSSDGLALARYVLNEIHIPLLTSPQTVEPSFDLTWDEGIVLCSGVADQ